MMLCRRHIAQVFLRPPLSTSRNIVTSSLRPVCIAIPKSRVPRAQVNRLFSTSTNDTGVFDWYINRDEYEKFLARANKHWPPPPSVPPNWSCTWSEWKALLTYYWPSPYYLMLPHIDMHVNIQYGIRGETRPILFSNERESFIFAIYDSKKYFLFDSHYNALYRIKDVRNDHHLVELVAQGDDALVTRLEAVEESEEGLAAIQRILRRDETVIPLLAKKFLHYTPRPTTPQMERNAPGSSPEQDAEFAEYMSNWQSDDKKLREPEERKGRLMSIMDRLLSKEERAEVRRLTDKEEEEDGDLFRKELSRFANVTTVESEEDLPPGELERAKMETKVLKETIDEIIKEMEDFPVEPHQEEVFRDMVATAKSLREGLDELSSTNSHAMAYYLARSLQRNFGIIKEDPKALEYLART